VDTGTPSPEAGTGAEGYLWVFTTEVQKTVANVLLKLNVRDINPLQPSVK